MRDGGEVAMQLVYSDSSVARAKGGALLVHAKWKRGEDVEASRYSADLQLRQLLRERYRDGKADKHGQPNVLQSAVLAHENRGYLAGPPIWLQKPGIAALAFIARRLGYKSRYERYSS